MRSLAWLVRRLGDVIWPRYCIYCGSDELSAPGVVCETCWSSLVPTGPRNKPDGLDSVRVAFAYDDRLRTIVHQFKFHNGRRLARPLAEHMVNHLEKAGFFPQRGIVVPVPDHPARRRDRGYNPAELIAEQAALLWELDFHPEFAVRVRYGPHQSKLPNEERRKALKDAFNVAICADPADILIFFDDVLHTGTTLSRLAKSARKAGWKRVEAVCLCT